MKNLKLILAGILVLGFSIISRSQCAYTFSTATGTYAPLTNTTSINLGQVWTMNSTYSVPLGFTLPLTAGRTCNAINVFAGRIDFPTTAAAYTLLLYHWPFGGNLLTDNGYGTSVSKSPIAFELTGTAGNRIAKIQFSNAGLEYDHASYCTGTLTGLDFVNFQYWFYEATGKIEVHFGPYSVNNPISYNCGGSSVSGPFMKFVVDNHFLNPYSNVNTPAITCFNNTGIVYGNPMYGTTGNSGLIHIYNPDPNYSISTGINSLTKNVISIYPNPASDVLNIKSESSLTNIEYTISDYTGRTLKAGELQDKIDISWLKPGIYFLTAEGETIKFIKQ